MMRDAAVPSLLGTLNAFRDRLVSHLSQVKVVEMGKEVLPLHPLSGVTHYLLAS
jgi:hypothetical protein